MKNFSAKGLGIIGSVVAAIVVIGAGIFWLLSSNGFDLSADNRQYAQILKIDMPRTTRYHLREPLRVVFSNNIAAAALLEGTVIDKGIEIRPELPGKWQFKTAAELTFTPKEDWIPGKTYEVRLTRDILAPGVELREEKFSFISPAFTGIKTEASFYEDPRNLRDKSAVAGFEFSFPLDEESIKPAVSVKNAAGEHYGFRYKLTEGGYRLYVISDPLKIGREADFVTIKVAGILSKDSHAVLSSPIEATIKVPGAEELFQVKNITTEIERDKQNDDRPEQVLDVAFSTAVDQNKLKEYLQVFYKDDNCYSLKQEAVKVGYDRNEIDGLKSLDITLDDRRQNNANTYRFRYHLPERGQCLMAVVRKGLSSADGFTLLTDEVRFLSAADYPLEAHLAYSGAVIPLRNNPVLQFAARGVKALDVKLARIESDDLNNLVTQTKGQFASPQFISYSFNEYNMAQVFAKKIPLNAEDPAEINYASLDLKPYIGKDKGIFIVILKGVFDEKYSSPEDRRLVVVTDLGLVVKDNLDRTHDVFVASLTQEKPVAGATVEVLGRNGLSIMQVKTDAGGHAKLPDLSGFEDEKQPVAYKVSLNGDVSYLPFNRYDLRVNYSRFAVGGAYVPEDKPDGLNAYVFSDRGIYRPGETVHTGIVLRQNNLEVPAHLPLEVEIMNPRGNTVSSGKIVSLEDGLMEYRYDIPAAAETGYYNLTLYRLDEKQRKNYVASGYFRVEEFEADTMKMTAKFVGQDAQGWQIGDKVSVEVSLANLYGNAAAGHEVKADYVLYPSGFYFEKYAGYVFADLPQEKGAPKLQTQKGTLAPVKTDAAGRAVLDIDLSRYQRGTYRLAVHIDGMEAGSGRGVSADIMSLVSPSDYIIGYKADGALQNIARQTPRGVKLIAVDNDLRQVERKDMIWRLKQKEYVSNLVEMPNGTYAYKTVTQEKEIREQAFDLPAEGYQLKLDTAESGEFVVYLEDQGKIVGKIEYTVGTTALTAAVDKEAGLVVKLNKSEYNAGDTVEAEISAPYAGYGLVTLERDDVYAYKWFKSSEPHAKVSLTLPREVEGNAYLNAAWFRSIKSEEIFMSPLSYAVVPFDINKTARQLDVELKVPEKVRPGDRLVIRYKTSAPAEMILWGVNEGILQIADYKTPDPLSFFMNKKALRVVTAQIMDMVMPEINIARFLKAPGGGAGAEARMLKAAATDMALNTNPFARKLNEVTAFWSGILQADTTEQQFVYEVPETFSGQIRIMAVAVNSQQFGHAEQSVLARGDFALVPSGPFQASPGDSFTIGLGVANLAEKGDGDTKIKVTAVPSAGVKITGEKEQTAVLPAGGEAVLTFAAAAEDILGSAEIHFTAEAMDGSGRKAGMPYYVGIRPAVPYMTDLQQGYRQDKLELKDFVIDMYPQYRLQEVSASGSPLVLAGGLLKYLDKFEHWCTEQTVSKVFPAMALMFKHQQMVDSDEVYKKFAEAVTVLTERQKLSGGFSSWATPLLGENPAVSLYATEFLVEAKRLGMNVPQNLLTKALNYTRGIAGQKPENIEDILPAYAAYILTRNGEITTNYLLNLEKELAAADAQNWKNTLSAAYLAAGYKLLQNEPKALAVLGQYRASDNYLDNVRYAYLTAEIFPDQFAGNAEKNIKLLLNPLERGFYTTWSAAYSILALNAFAGEPGSDKNIVFEGKEGNYGLFANLPLMAGEDRLTVVSDKPFYYVVRQQGYRRGAVDKAESSGIEISKQYLDKDGKPVENVGLGDEVEVVIKLRSLTGEDIFDVAVVDLLPGGADIVRDSVSSETFLDFSETREDRLTAYLTVSPTGNVIRYKITAVSRGDFAVPPVYAEALYDTTVKAHDVSSRLVVE